MKVAEGSVIGYAQIVAPDGKAVTTGGAPTLGVNWNQNATLGPLRLRTGRAPAATGRGGHRRGDVPKAQKIDVGARVGILAQGPPEEYTVVGVAGFGEADNLAGATLAAFDTATAQRVLGKVGQYDTIDMQADEGVSAFELRTRVEEVLPAACAGVEPDGCEAVTGDQLAQEGADQVQGFIGIFKTALLVFAFISLFVGAFIIVNTFSILVAQRTRELALLRALGRQPPPGDDLGGGRGGGRSAWWRRRSAWAWASSWPSGCRACSTPSASACPAPAPSSSPARSSSRW